MSCPAKNPECDGTRQREGGPDGPCLCSPTMTKLVRERRSVEAHAIELYGAVKALLPHLPAEGGLGPRRFSALARAVSALRAVMARVEDQS